MSSASSFGRSPDWDGDVTDYLTDDLAMMVTALREAGATGQKG